MSSAILSDNQINNAENLMHKFFVSAEMLYGLDFVIFNMHLHLHTHDVYGPCYGY